MAPVCPRAWSARVSSRVCHPSRAARTTRCRLLLLADEGGEAVGHEVLEVITHLLEGGRGGTFLELVHRVEAELRLPILGGSGAVEVRHEPGEIGTHEADLLLCRAHQ